MPFAPQRGVAHAKRALFPPNLAFGKEGGQACRSRPRKIPHKSQGVYLTFIPLPAPQRRGLVAVRTRGGYLKKFLRNFLSIQGGTESPLENAKKPPEGGLFCES